MTRADLVAAARTYLGVPWKHYGRTRNGVDCVGLIVLSLEDAGAPVEDSRVYGKMHRNGDLMEALRGRADRRVAINRTLPGDVLTFAYGKYQCHVGFVAGKDGQRTVIHAYNRPDEQFPSTVIEEPLEGYLWSLARSAFVPRGLED